MDQFNNHYTVPVVPNSSNGSDHFFCGFCPRAVKRPATLRDHVLTFHNRFMCQRCFLHYPTKQEELDHHCSKLFYCTRCTRKFSNNQQYDVHFYQVHVNSEVAYRCKLCGFEFATQGRLNQHKGLVHSRIFNGPGKCKAKSISSCKCKNKHTFQPF